MSDPIGIVACSAPGAALCYETICTEAGERLGEHAHPEIAMHAVSFAEHVAALEAGDWDRVGALLMRSLEKVAAMGAAFAICPDNTAHQAFDLTTPPIPWLHIADAVASEARRVGARRVGLLGTRWLMEGPVYPPRLESSGIECRIPSSDRRERVNRLIFDDLVHGRVPEAGRAALLGIIDGLVADEACDAIVLGCTELPLAVSSEDRDVPLLDSTRILARAAIRRSIEGA